MAQIDNHVEDIMGSISWETHDNPTTLKTTYDNTRRFVLAKEWNSFHLSRKKLHYLPLRIFSNTNVNCIWSNHWLHHSARTSLPTAPRTHRLAIETKQWTTIPISRDTRLCHLCSYNVIENDTHFMLGCPLHNPIRDDFSWLLESMVNGSLKSFIELDHQFDIRLHHTDATTLHFR